MMVKVLSERKQQRCAYVAPLFAYCADHCLAPLMVARRAAIRASAHAAASSASSPVVPMNRLRLSRIKHGTSACPPWFIAEMCREIGQPVEVVMGAEWAQRHLPALTPDLASDLSPDLSPEQRAS
jgi:hypothetical protein